MSTRVRDLIGIGFGPANIALAVALEEQDDVDGVLFLEARPSVAWQPGMMISGADIQNHPLRDLVTPRNPTSRYSFVNFLHQHDRLLPFLNLGLEFPLRKEYAMYIAWVASCLSHRVLYNNRVERVKVDDETNGYRISCADGVVHLCRALILAPGREPFIPTVFEGTLGDRVFHLNDFLPRSQTILEAKPDSHICVVGSSQSAVEIVLDLHRRFAQAKITNIMRSFGYQLKDTSPFSEEVYFPDFVDYFFDSTPASKIDLTAELRRTNYSSADRDVIHQFYLVLYEQQLDGGERLSLQRNSDITLARLTDQCVELSIIERHRGTARTITADGVVLATGFRNFGPGRDDEQIPKLLSPIRDRLALNDRGFLHVNRDYSLSSSDPDAPLPPIYVNGLCESSHGFGDAGSFSLLSLRSAEIVRSLQSRLRTSVPHTVPMDRVKTVAAV